MSTWILILYASMGVSTSVGPFQTLEQCEAVAAQWMEVEGMNTKYAWCLEVPPVPDRQKENNDG